MNKVIVATLMTLVGCSQPYIESPIVYQVRQITTEKEIPKQINVAKKISFELSDLCDTELYEKEFNLRVYIQPSEKLWDYHEFRDEIFNYVDSFFRQHNINFNIEYTKEQLQNSFTSPDTKSLEIFDSSKGMEERFYALLPNELRDREFGDAKGYAATQVGVALIDGGWEEFREYLDSDELRKRFEDKNKDMTVKEYILRSNANNITHELLHCMGLWHPYTFHPTLVQADEKDIPNIMSFYPPKFSDDLPLGAKLTKLQQKVLHSYLAGNNTYKAFFSCDNDLDIFLRKISVDNPIIKMK